MVDPDYLNDGTEIIITPASKTVQLVETGNLTSDGVTIKCVYSKLKELWKTNNTYIKYAFPMTPITDEQFEMVNDWDWADSTTRYLLRTGGWAVKNTGGISTAEWSGIVGLGSLESDAQVYFQQGLAGAAGSAASNFQLTGQVNQAIQVYASGGDDFRSYLKLFCRHWGYSFAQVEIDDIGVSTLTYQAYRFPLTHVADPKVTQPMSAMSASPYTDISAAWYSAAQQRDIGGTNRDFHVIIDASDENLEDAYMRIQYLLLSGGNINTGGTYGTVVGDTADHLLHFTGDTLYTEFYSIEPTGGTYIDNFQTDDINRLIFVDDTGTERQFPYTAVLTLQFGANVYGDSNSKYWVYFTDIPSGNYGDSDAYLVNTDNYVATVARARNSNTAYLTAANAHGLSAEDGIEVVDVGGAGYNGVWIVLDTPSNTELSYACTAGDESYTADTDGTIYEQMAGKVWGQSSVQKSFAYDTNSQGGRTSGSNADVTAVSIGLSSSQFVLATGTIQRSTANSVSLVSALERNYQNPA